MKWKQLLDEAFQKGEQVKEDLLVELVHSKMVNELLRSDKFARAVTTLMQTKEEVAKLIQKQVKHILQFIDIPDRGDIDALEHKLSRLSHELDRVNQRARVYAGKRALQKKSTKKK